MIAFWHRRRCYRQRTAGGPQFERHNVGRKPNIEEGNEIDSRSSTVGFAGYSTIDVALIN